MSENIQQIYVANPTTAMAATDLLYLGRSPYGVSDDFAIVWSNMQLSITAVGIITAGTWNGTTIAVNRGGTGVTSVTTAPTATSFAGWDASSNLSASNFIPGFATTATAAATTTLTVASKNTQEFTGSTTQIVVMPVTSTLVAGFQFKIINNSSDAVTVNSSGGNPIQVMAANTTLYLTCVLNSGTTAASWNSTYITDGAGVLSITGTTNQVIASAATGNVTLSLPQDIGTGSSPSFAGLSLTVTPLGVTSGGTGLSSTTANQLLYSSATSTIAGLATANNGILVTSAGGVPSIGNTVGADLTINTVRVGLGNNGIASNTLVGNVAMGAITTGTQNTGMGQGTFNVLEDGIQNSGFGFSVLSASVSGNYNTGAGFVTFGSVTSGSGNTGFGWQTGRAGATGAVALTTGSNNTFLGYASASNSASAVGVLALGSDAVADIATGVGSGDNGPGVAVGSAAHPVGFRGDGTIYPSTTGSGFWRQKINGTYYQTLLFADASTGLPALTAPSINFGGSTLSSYVTGTFTPTMTFAVVGDLSVAYAIQTGTYIRIGSQVWFNITIRFTPTYTTASGRALFGTLPVAMNVTPGYAFGATINESTVWPIGATQMYSNAATTTTLYIAGIGTGTAVADFVETAFPTGVERTVVINGVYTV